MIVASLLFIMMAVVLLAAGVWQPSGVLLSASIAASLLAAVMLVAGARRAVTDPDEPDHDDDRTRPAPPPPVRHGVGSDLARPATVVVPVQGGSVADQYVADRYEVEDHDPPDEPAPQQVSAADAARVGRMPTEVLVVDGRPRYHLPGCVHLLGRQSEPLPVSDAVALGFTPCGLCEPDSALLAGAHQR